MCESERVSRVGAEEGRRDERNNRTDATFRLLWGCCEDSLPVETTQVVRIERGGKGGQTEEEFPFVKMARKGDRLAVDVVADEQGRENVVE